MSYLLKDPQSNLDYEIDWGMEYLGEGDLLVQSSWDVSPEEPDGLAVQASTHDSMRAHVTVAGGVPGHVYRLGNSVVTALGRVDRRSLTLRVEAR